MALSDKIWITRRTRVYTEKRLRFYSLVWEIIIIIYSLSMVFLSIFNIFTPSTNINLLLICSSISLLSLSIFVSSQKYNERAGSIKNCYIRLDELYSKVILAEQNSNVQLLNDYMANYCDILLNVENHSNFDYLCFRFSVRNRDDTTLEPFRVMDKFSYYKHLIFRIVLFTLIFLTPIFIFYIWKYFI